MFAVGQHGSGGGTEGFLLALPAYMPCRKLVDFLPSLLFAKASHLPASLPHEEHLAHDRPTLPLPLPHPHGIFAWGWAQPAEEEALGRERVGFLLLFLRQASP